MNREVRRTNECFGCNYTDSRIVDSDYWNEKVSLWLHSPGRTAGERRRRGLKTHVRMEPQTLCRCAEEYLLKNLGRHVTLEELTDVLGVSGTTLKKHFHEIHGISLYAWFKRQRMLAAAQALKDSGDSILKIAGDYGYENASKFSCAFRDVTGVSPREYRKTCQSVF